MALYLISYDLNKPEKDYPKLISYLESISAHRVLYSEWFLRSSSDRDAVYNAVKSRIDDNDGLLVCVVDSAIGCNLKYDISKV